MECCQVPAVLCHYIMVQETEMVILEGFDVFGSTPHVEKNRKKNNRGINKICAICVYDGSSLQ